MTTMEATRERGLLARLNFTDRLVLVTGGAMFLAVSAASVAAIDGQAMPLFLGLTLVVMALGLRLADGGGARQAAFARLPGYLMWVWFFHSTAGVLIGGLGLPRYEAELNAIDVAVLGEPITVLLQSLHDPVLTEITQVAYNLYYFVVLAIPLALAWQGRRRAFFEAAAILLTIHAVTVVFTLALPAMWPTLLADQPGLTGLIHYSFPIEGLQFTEALREATATSTPHVFDTFPSGHTGMTIGAILVAARYMPRYLLILAPFGALIIFGTVYLRYHYGVDLVAGALNAFVVTWLVRRARHGGDEGEGGPLRPASSEAT